jgi:hypothetical protein
MKKFILVIWIGFSFASCQGKKENDDNNQITPSTEEVYQQSKQAADSSASLENSVDSLLTEIQ